MKLTNTMWRDQTKKCARIQTEKNRNREGERKRGRKRRRERGRGREFRLLATEKNNNKCDNTGTYIEQVK